MLDKHRRSCYIPSMELRILRYFMAVAEEGGISRAANVLHITQPTLSRQMMDLEEELGCKLFKRGSHSVSLTPEGRQLRRRAEDILELVARTEHEFRREGRQLAGEVAIGAGETCAFRQLARAACELRRRHPAVRFQLHSGNKEDVTERLDKGLLDFGLLIQPADISRYCSFHLQETDAWGVLMRKDSPLAARQAITREDLAHAPLLLSRQVTKSPGGNALLDWLDLRPQELHAAVTYNLIYNAAVMVREGMGYAITLAGLADCSEGSPLCFRPLSPPIEAGLDVVWVKNRPLSAASAAFLQLLMARASGHVA